jgi:2-desacetyl-2-hydroxyethyl bacteriochlorophyllide A dehydrogenase
MKAKALICDRNQNFTLQDVVLKDPSDDQVAIRTHFTGVSVGTEFALIRNKLSWGPYPICTGYQGTGVVEKVGRNVKDLNPGDKVYFRGGGGMELPGGKAVSCVSGGHCAHVVTTVGTSHGAARLPEGVAMDVASQFVTAAVGLHGTDMANPRTGSTVLVYGAGLIGLGVVAACSHRGCVIIAVDVKSRLLEISRLLGADHVINASRQDVAAELAKIAPAGADVVFECTGLPECVDAAVGLCRKSGSFVWQGNYGQAPLSMRFLPAHERQLKMFFPCDDGMQPCRHAVLKNMAAGTLKWDSVITHRIKRTEAPAMFDSINKGTARDTVGIVIHWAG